MGTSRSHEIKEFRSKILRLLVSNTAIAELMGITVDKAPEVLPYKYISPCEPVPDVILETDRFINYDMEVYLDKKNNTFKDIDIFFFICCHNDVARTPYGLWYDDVVCEIDNIFGGQNILGVGKMMMSYNKPYRPNEKFLGRVLCFSVKDFTNGLRNGK